MNEPGGESEPLLPRPADVGAGAPDVPEKPLKELPFYWPCLATGVVFNTLAVCASVKITQDFLDNPDRAAYIQRNWWIVWLVGLLVLIVAVPAFLFTMLVVTLARGVLGPRGAFPSWASLIALSYSGGLVFYGLFNATYPFSFFLQIQVYSVFTAFGLCAYTVFAFVLQCVPVLGEFNPTIGWLFTLASNIIAYVHLTDIFAFLDYPLSRTAGDGLWHPWVALLIVLLFFSTGTLQTIGSTGASARFFEDTPAQTQEDLEASKTA